MQFPGSGFLNIALAEARETSEARDFSTQIMHVSCLLHGEGDVVQAHGPVAMPRLEGSLRPC